MRLVKFKLSGRFAHFLRAEASRCALSYPVPPRTVILGLIGAVLGIPKDQPQCVLEPAHISLCGSMPLTHWHRVKLRKDPPETLNWKIKVSMKPKKKTSPEKATLILQEWLFKPTYTVLASLPEPYLNELESRLKERRWHFQPSLGLSEMMADLEYIESLEASLMPPGRYKINSIFRQDKGEVDFEQALTDQLAIHSFNMPVSVTPDRVFSLATYFMERDGRPISVKTNQAYKASDKFLTFL